MNASSLPLLFATALLLAGCAARPAIVRLDGESMGSTWTVKYVGAESSSPGVRAAIEHELAEIDAQMSTWKPESPLSRFNAAPAASWHVLPEALFGVMQRALALAADTDGAYDPTVGPLVELWGFGPGKARREPPTAAEIDRVRARVGWQRVQLDEAGRRAFQAGGVHVDLSSIAPGYATDRIGEILGARGCADYLVEVGGELRARGQKPDGGAWQVAVQRPLDNDHSDGAIDAQHIVALRDAALGSSGDYRHFFEDNGRRYAHRIDPRTGWPLDNDVASVTALAKRGIDADPYATALSVLGPDAGMAFARTHGFGALFILRNGERLEERMSEVFAASLSR
ncbi:MAG: FAD:protein FMN transferase [Xanthomonadales bacterium]|nr:FAD:protein FMN transferase [Xanthomonadales bacterium]